MTAQLSRYQYCSVKNISSSFQVSDSGIRTLARRCYKLRYLNARGCGALGDDGVEAIGRGCSRLRALDLGATDVSEAGLQVNNIDLDVTGKKLTR